MKKKSTVLLVVLLAVAAVMIWTIWANTALELNTFTVSSEQLPKSFDGFRIVQVSDLHNAEFGKGNKKLLDMLNEAKPDIIAVTGDLIDSRHTDIDAVLGFAKEAVKLAPCCFVTGNHEAWIDNYVQLEAGLAECGVTVMHDSEVVLKRGGEQIALLGIDDPSFARRNGGGVASSMSPEEISALSKTDNFAVLLSHRPEFFEQYCEAGVDLVLSGHAHGGQIRLPFVGGLVAPNQGLFPEYDSGLYTFGGTSMIVSRGIGNSIVPLRFNNRPEIIAVELDCGE